LVDLKKAEEVRQMMEAHRTYIPAGGHDWTLPFYDPLVKLLGGNAAREALVLQAGLEPGERVQAAPAHCS
jgi:hypothetical protein